MIDPATVEAVAKAIWGSGIPAARPVTGDLSWEDLRHLASYSECGQRMLAAVFAEAEAAIKAYENHAKDMRERTMDS